MGKATKREYRFSRIVRANTRICEKTISTNKAFPNGEGCDTRIPLSPKHSLSRVGKAKRRRLRRQKKKANPASLRSAAPSKGRGLRGYSLLPLEGGAPKGRRLDGDGGMKKSGEIVSSTPLTRAPYPPLTRSPFPSRGRCPGAERPATICGEAATTTRNPEP